ncbi:MAG: prolyl oligopeptidase family serine peptidase, partial [Limisphaerales bacterium]
RRTLEDSIFYRTKDFAFAEKLLAMGAERAQELRVGKTPWNDQTGLVVRAYVSSIDGSLQPFGLWISPEWKRDGNRRRLDVWYHGRNDKLSEVSFLDRRLSRPAPFSPPNGIVLYPYGRFCNAMKFAGETDTFEALEHLKQFYGIDENRISVRGFSMGGAAAWHIGTHHSSKWVAVNPGAGFAETKIYQKLTEKLDEFPWYEKKLWGLYDAVDVAVNLENTGLVAYSGEIDKQKEAADLMEAALKKEGLQMTHIIGPKTGHKYEKGARDKVEKLVDGIARRGRNLIPKNVRFVTPTLKYNRMHWVQIDALENHWDLARVGVSLTSTGIVATTHNVARLTLDPKTMRISRAKVTIDGQSLAKAKLDPSDMWAVNYQKRNGKWEAAKPVSGLRKKSGLQGPIDDAFMSSFVMVPPDAKGWSERTDSWVKEELADASFQWRRQFRGEARVKSVAEVSAADIKNSHLVLWGDPESNSLIARLLPFLPVEWSQDSVRMAGKKHDAAGHVPALVFPNPLNPEKYVVLNSGFTFAHFGSMSNSRQTPKLPDWAVLDVNVAASERKQGNGVVSAGFFDESWRASIPGARNH